MEHDWLLLSIRYSNVTGIHRLATELDVADRRLASSVDDSHPCQLGVWLPHSSEHGVLAGKYLVTVRVAKLTNNRVLLAGLIAVSCQILLNSSTTIWFILEDTAIRPARKTRLFVSFATRTGTQLFPGKTPM